MANNPELKISNQDEFEKAVRPLIKYLAENHHPHTTVIVSNTGAEILEGIRSVKIEDYLVD